MSRALLLALAVAVTGCDGMEAPVFIAFQRDFAAFESWPSVSIGEPAFNHGTEARTGFRNQMPSGGKYAVGTILVKTVESGTTFTDWELFAMAKRGRDFNAGGARDWEFFTLKLNADRVPIIVARGTNPVEGATGAHGYVDPSSMVTCNRCHGAPGSEQTDHVISAALAP
jgi:hypothetical protein